MQFSVPQFIDIEDKIIGPLTIKQFLWLLAAAVILFIIWTALPLLLFIIAAIPVAGLFGALAFLKVNGRPFINFIISGFSFLITPKLYLFKKAEKARKPIIEKTQKLKQEKIKTKPNLSDLAWKLDVQN